MKKSYSSSGRADWATRMPLVLVTIATTFLSAESPGATTPVELGAAASFAGLAGAGITISGPTTINGDIGSYETATITGLDNLTLTGINHGGDPVTQAAKGDLTVAYNDSAGRALDVTYADAFDVGGLTLAPGVYKAPTSLFLTGELTLDAQGDENGVWIFQVGTTLISATDGKVALSGGAQARNVFWQVGSSATFGNGTDFVGNVMADQSITFNTGATLDGRALARIGGLVLNANTMTVPAVPEPGTGLLLGAGLAGWFLWKRRVSA